MVRVVVFLLLVNIALVILALIDCLSAEKHEVRNAPRWMWTLAILFLSPFAAVAWFMAGRPTPDSESADVLAAPMPAPTADPGKRQLAPDDDPEFLRDLAARTRKANEDRHRDWNDGSARGEEDRGRTDDPPPIN